MRAFVSLLGVLVAACSAQGMKVPSGARQSLVTTDTIDAIETRIVLPQNARPLDAYDRFYATDIIAERSYVHGVFLLRQLFGHADRSGMEAVVGHPNVYRGDTSDLPMVADGGCSVLTSFFDPSSGHFVEIQTESGGRSTVVCNGVG